ncbi:GntR family transcriptional regulator [Conexibacter sp. JD483]|uniref:GntR family transcriptional regulator n=1 Tax=unclassified Conexibacter TaxID=2627773 RepID=UPI0027236DCB|nr:MULTISPECIES: GntR family transcriptional regulator [unclassified Conexibacter]MDO8189040.1 GntR family transcriptional regulator [Conexibacter sp. CPCC 205706]MDO8198519.1 GntR family transcriptional regulator [Conexibacter sp. CPCC 205762]MDR9367605.1 GntR family transcriptional regulator [Conexibacter sp. JD483]
MSRARESHLPRYLEIAEELEASIRRGDLGEGELLPGELELAKRWSVNRHTVGRALNHLQQMGLVARVKGHGTHVRPPRLDYRIADQVSFTAMFEAVGARVRKQPPTIHAARADATLATLMRIPVGEELVGVRNGSAVGGSPLSWGVGYFREAVLPGVADLLAGFRGSTSELFRSVYGIELFRAQTRFEVQPAEPEAAAQLRVAIGFPLFKVEKLDTLSDGTPAVWGLSYFRSDAVRFDVQTRPIITVGA